jgi:hypothetical protein
MMVDKKWWYFVELALIMLQPGDGGCDGGEMVAWVTSYSDFFTWVSSEGANYGQERWGQKSRK